MKKNILILAVVCISLQIGPVDPTNLISQTNKDLQVDTKIPQIKQRLEIIASKRVARVGEDIILTVTDNLLFKKSRTLQMPFQYIYCFRVKLDNMNNIEIRPVTFGYKPVNTLTVAECLVEVRYDTSYDFQVDVTAYRFAKSYEWVQWMKSDDVRPHFENAWECSKNKPTKLKVTFHYYNNIPILYDPPFKSENEHMACLEKLTNLSFPGFDFDFYYNAPKASADITFEVGTASGSWAIYCGNYAYCHYETIVPHEFSHIFGILHHYTDDNTPIFLPPDEPYCLMARSSSEFCSACRTVLYLDLDADNESELDAVIQDIYSRIP